MKSTRDTGFVLTELLVAGLLTTFLMLGIIQMAAGVSRGLLLIESQSHTQQGGRFAIDQIRSATMAAGFNPAPWEGDGEVSALGDATSDGGPGGNDILVLRQQSDKNCYGNPNTSLDGSGNPAFFLRESTFEVNASNNLAHTCWFGPDSGSLVRQINREGLVQHVDSFQVLFAEDTDGDRLANRTVRAGAWLEPSQVVGVQLGLLVASEKPVSDHVPPTFTVLDEVVTPQSDGRLRKTWTTNIPMVSRLR